MAGLQRWRGEGSFIQDVFFSEKLFPGMPASGAAETAQGFDSVYG
jgi:hypothetical protein